jgi:2-amino-4-hydroxy-6-hydroxymethyldihydropteridine diphosphokinase
LGRNRGEELKIKAESGERYCSRTLDLDILFYDEEQILTERLQVPHPLIMEREFVMVPLCELLQCNRVELREKIDKIYG